MFFLPIPSTRGPITLRSVERSGETPAEIRREGDYRPLEMSSDYRALGRAGLIGRRGGVDLPDLMIARDIDGGSSWQLPVALFDTLRREGCPTTPDVEAATAAVFATGALCDDGRIEEHDYALDLKWPAWTAATRIPLPTLVLLPPSPRREDLAHRLRTSGAADLQVADVDDLAGATETLRRWAHAVVPSPRRPAKRRRLRSIAAAGSVMIAIAVVAISAGMGHRGSTGSPRRGIESGAPSPVANKTPDVDAAPVSPTAPPVPLDVTVAALHTRDGSPCPSVELDTALLRPTPLPIGDDLVVALPKDIPVCGIELTPRPGGSTQVVVTPEARRRALLTRLPDGTLRLRPRLGRTVADLEIEVARGADPERRHLRFVPR